MLAHGGSAERHGPIGNGEVAAALRKSRVERPTPNAAAHSSSITPAMLGAVDAVSGVLSPGPPPSCVPIERRRSGRRAARRRNLPPFDTDRDLLFAGRAMDSEGLDPGQLGLGDMDPESFRRYGHQVVDWIAEYLAHPEAWPVLPRLSPGDIRAALPASPPEKPEPMPEILADFDRIIAPATTHWNHPGFFAYFAITGSGPGILGEALAAALNVNAMLWRTGPSATELEEVALDWLRQILGLPEGFDGTINDTASSSTLYALAAAREAAPELRVREAGSRGRPELPRLRVYCSEEAHSSVDKAAITLGLGLEGVTRIATDAEYRMDVEALERAIAEDRAAGHPADRRRRHRRHDVDHGDRPGPGDCGALRTRGTVAARRCGVRRLLAAIPERRDVLAGADRADSLVVNPAQVALHARRLLGPLHAPAGRAEARLQPGAGIPEGARRRGGAEPHGLRRRTGPALPCPQALVRAALLRRGRDRGAAPASTFSWPRASPPGSTRPRTSSASRPRPCRSSSSAAAPKAWTTRPHSTSTTPDSSSG